MIGRGRDALPGAALVVVVLLGVVFFGAVQTETRGAFAALVMAVSGGILLLSPREVRPRGAWVLASLVFPAWILIQLVPLPLGLLGLLSPTGASWHRELWPGPASDCGGALLAAAPPSWHPLTVDAYATREFLFHVSAAMLCFLAARAMCAAAGTMRRGALWAIALFASAEAVYGIAQALAESPHVLWVVKTAFLDCASGTLINRNHFAMVLYLGLGATLALLLERLEYEVEHGDHRETALRVTLGLFAGLQLAAMLASKSRAGAAGAMLVLLSAFPALRRVSRRVRLTVLGLALAVVLPLVVFTGSNVAQRLTQIAGEWKGDSSRGGVLRLSGAYLRDFAMTGSGGGTFAFAFSRYRTSTVTGLFDYAHNDYLQTAVETGVPGILFAVLPLALFAFEWRGWRKRVAAQEEGDEEDDSPALPWPLYAALGVTLLHEFVDFGLNIPALAALFGLLAGLAAPPARGRVGRLSSLLPVWFGFALVLPALAQSAVSWPAVGKFVTWPTDPTVSHRRAADLLVRWQAKPADATPACEGLGPVVRARVLRPLEARYTLTHARLLMASAERTGASAAEQDRMRGDARRALDQIRASDPWDAFNREGVLNVALALGDLDKAAEDALAITKVSPDQASTVLRSLLAVGIPATSIQNVMTRSPEALGSVLKALADENDFANAGLLVPPDIKADAVTCRVGWLIVRILDKAHHATPLPFLEGCRLVPEIQHDDKVSAYVAGWTASALMDAGRYDEAAPFVARAPVGALRIQLEMNLAEHRGAWRDVIVFGEKLLLSEGAPTDPAALAWLHYRLGLAYAHDDQLGPARQELQSARELDPTLEPAERMLNDLAIGKNPVR